jgi:hypothetical protein
MPEPIETAKVRVVTIFAAEELLDGLTAHLRASGASGYTFNRADGQGLHGPSRSGLLAVGNVRIEILLPPAAARALLEQLARVYRGRELIAFSYEVDAIPRGHFG